MFETVFGLLPPVTHITSLDSSGSGKVQPPDKFRYPILHLTLATLPSRYPSHIFPQVVVAEGASVVVKSEPPRSFTFDGVLGETATQQALVKWGGWWVGRRGVLEEGGR